MFGTRTRWIVQALRSPHIALLMRLMVGGVLVFSAVTKLPLHSQFVGVVEGYNLLPGPLAEAYALALPWVELLVGAYLVLGILLRPSAAVTILMGISFTVANVSAIIQGEQYCGSCLGQAVTLAVWQALTLDILIIIAALLLLLAGGREQLLGLDGWFARKTASRAQE